MMPMIQEEETHLQCHLTKQRLDNGNDGTVTIEVGRDFSNDKHLPPKCQSPLQKCRVVQKDHVEAVCKTSDQWYRGPQLSPMKV